MTAFTLKSKLKLGAAFLEDRYGGAAIIMGLMTPIIIGGLAFGAEVGGWELTKRQIQNAADTAAFAAGTQVRSDASAATIESAAEMVAEASGFDGGSDNVDIEHPPTSAPIAADGTDPNGNNGYVYVTLTNVENRNFTKFFSSSDTVTFQAAALAHVENGRPACVLALHPSASGAVETGGSTTVALSGCDIAANSISTSAITATGMGSSVTADCISAVGNVSVNATYDLTCDEPIANGPKTSDPYANIPMPTAATCTSTGNANQFTGSGGGGAWTPNGSGAVRCYTGTASGGGAWSFPRNISLTSNTAYVLENTSASAASMILNGSQTITGTNVTLIFKGLWNVKLNGNSTINITAQTSGTYKGIAMFGDRSKAVNIDLTGNNGAKIVGAVYSANKNSTVTYRGSNVAYSSGQCTQVIAGKVLFSGNSNFSTSCSNSGTTAIMAGQTIKIVG